MHFHEIGSSDGNRRSGASLVVDVRAPRNRPIGAETVKQNWTRPLMHLDNRSPSQRHRRSKPIVVLGSTHKGYRAIRIELTGFKEKGGGVRRRRLMYSDDLSAASRYGRRESAFKVNSRRPLDLSIGKTKVNCGE